jgi:hypothetical protein
MDYFLDHFLFNIYRIQIGDTYSNEWMQFHIRTTCAGKLYGMIQNCLDLVLFLDSFTKRSTAVIDGQFVITCVKTETAELYRIPLKYESDKFV